MAEEYSTNRSDLVHIQGRVREKIKDHVHYDFSPLQNNLLKSFFDLVQEYDRLDDFYRICVVVLLESMKVESSLSSLNFVEPATRPQPPPPPSSLEHSIGSRILASSWNMVVIWPHRRHLNAAS